MTVDRRRPAPSGPTPGGLLLGLGVIATLVLAGCGDDGGGAAPASSGAPADAPADGWWRPDADATWQWQLLGEVNTGHDVDVYDIDLLDTPAETIAALHGDGRRVVCYYSAGSLEEWRDDVGSIEPDAIGATLDGWDDERWLDVTDPSVRALMADRLDLAVRKGCDGVEPDNVDGHDNETGLSFGRADQLAYNRWTADEAHARGLAVGLKNALGQVDDLVGHYDFAVNEECWAHEECDRLVPFVAAGKPVFHAEYEARFVDEGGCADTAALGLRSLLLPLDLDDSLRVACD